MDTPPMNDAPAMTGPSRNVEIDSNISGEEAIRRIGQSCLKLLRHYEGLALDHQPEGVHQMRVSIRRLRAALASYRKSFPANQYKWVHRELRWLADVLGEARDLDVFEYSLLAKASESFRETGWVKLPIQDARAQAYEAVEAAIHSPRYHALKAGLSLWCDVPFANAVNADGDLRVPLSITVPNILGRRYRRAMKLLGNYWDKSNKKRHRLRIALKKLRYTSELFGTIYNTKLVDEFTRRLKRVQDDLGDEHDVLVARGLFDHIARDCSPEIQKVGTAIIGWHERRVAEHEDRTMRHLQRFAETPVFWEKHAT